MSREPHPVADLFPMLTDEELDDLAADIKGRGLLHPIVLDAEGRVLDGRNRYAACLRVNVEPSFVTYDGDDPDGYALAVNLGRRNLTKGQSAMIAARSLSVSNTPQGQAARTVGVSRTRVAQATVVLAYAPDLADAVIAGAVPLDEAYAQARDRKKAATDTAHQLDLLRDHAPDLADLVTEETLTLAGALGELRAREAQAESERRAALANLRSVLTYTVSEAVSPEALAKQYADVLDEIDADDLHFAADTLAALAAMKEATA